MTAAGQALADLLTPHRDRLRLPPIEAARMFRLVTFSSAHPAITDGHVLTTPEIVDLLLHGIGAVPGRPPADADRARSESETNAVGML